VNSFIPAFLGGVLIGLATSFFLFFKGRIFGISGILGGFFKIKATDFSWRFATVGGLVTGGALSSLCIPESFQIRQESLVVLVLAGLLVGFGTQLGGGCTSGHGICGVSRFSPRSLTATAIFMFTGMLAVFFLRKGGI
jgi:uncharacterized membrane protein YedE/YeeE